MTAPLLAPATASQTSAPEGAAGAVDFANSRAALGAAPADLLPAALEEEIRRIYARSPLYGRRFPLHPSPLQWSCYRELPALSKREIVERGHLAFFAD